jgi:thiamine-monophosphate kinase
MIPISDDALKGENPLNAALNDGEDFELLFTLSDEDCRILLKKLYGSVPITQIGKITDTMKMQIKMPDDLIKDLEAGGYDHLKGGREL